jgi:hypothetical protein
MARRDENGQSHRKVGWAIVRIQETGTGNKSPIMIFENGDRNLVRSFKFPSSTGFNCWMINTT